MKMLRPLLPVKFSLIILLLLQVACGGDKTQKKGSTQNLEEQLIEFNRNAAGVEEKIIQHYLSDKEIKMQRTGTGLWYRILNPGIGDSIVEGQMITIDFDVLLLNDSLCYSSQGKDPMQFKLGMADIESGIHEGMYLLKEGAIAHFILPSHLAHGLTGDNNKIPPNSPVIYKIHVVKVE